MRYPHLFPLVLALLLTTAICTAQEPSTRQQILALQAAGQTAEALEAAHQWTLQRPDLPEPLLLYADLQEGSSDFEGALDSLDAAYFLTRDTNLLVRKGYVYMTARRLTQAENQFSQVLRVQETLVGAHIGLAQVMLEKGNIEQAAAATRAALSLDPESIEALVMMARLRLDGHAYDEAEKLLLRALAIQPQSPQVHLWLGKLYAETKQGTAARQHWEQYVALEPDSSEAWLLRNDLFPIAARPYACTGYYPVFSPDGKQLAYRGRGDAGNVYLCPVNSPETFTCIYSSPTTIYSLDWSPDGQHLLLRDYLSETVDGKAQYKYRLIVIDTTGKAEPKTVYEGAFVSPGCWSHDGKSVLFDAYVSGKGRPLLIAPASGGETRVALETNPYESYTACLAHLDGKRFLLQRWTSQDREYQLVLVDPANRSQDQVLVHAEQSFYSPSISPDGRCVLYYRRIGQPPAWDLMVLSLASPGQAHPLGFRTPTTMSPAAFTADGRHLLMYVGQTMYFYDLQGLGSKSQ